MSETTATPPPAAPGSAGRGEPEMVRLSMMRRAMARRLAEAATVPVFYLRLRADVSGLFAERARLREAGAGGVPSVNDYVLAATARALRAHPTVNASWADGEVALLPRVNVGVAIAIPDGLVVPAIYDADRLSAAEIGATTRALAESAKARRLSREELRDATFTVSNLGMFGIEDFDPVINPPQAAILGVGAAAEGPDGRRLLGLTLGCDHRVLTGSEGAEFLATVKAGLEEVGA
jgi:pyruvate dehydrogenase E2 component (dihydrolipoamide acetyltransferase)